MNLKYYNLIGNLVNKPKRSKPSPLYRKLDLTSNRYYKLFLNELVNVLSITYNGNIQCEMLEKQIFETQGLDDEFTYTTPRISGYEINIKSHINLMFHPLGKGICLFNFEVNQSNRGSGIGSTIMKIMTDISDRCEVPIYLIPIQISQNVSYNTLKRFYHRFGFKRSHKSYYWVYDKPKFNIQMAA